MRPLLHTYMHVCQSPKCLTLDLSRIFPHPSIQNVFMLHSFHSIYTFSSCPSWPRRPLSRNVPMSRHIIDCFMSIFESLRYPYMHLYVHFIPHTHTHTPVSLRSLHFYWSSIAVPSRPLFRPLVSSTSFCIPPSKFFQTSHSSFLPFTLEKPVFVPKCLKSKCLMSIHLSFPPFNHPSLHPLTCTSSIYQCIYLELVFVHFLPVSATPPPQYLNQCTMRASFHPFFTPSTHLFFHLCWKTCICSIYLYIDPCLELVFHPMCFVSSILPGSLHPPSKISHIYLSHVHIFFFYWHQPSIFSSIHSWMPVRNP